MRHLYSSKDLKRLFWKLSESLQDYLLEGWKTLRPNSRARVFSLRDTLGRPISPESQSNGANLIGGEWQLFPSRDRMFHRPLIHGPILGP